MGRLLIFAAVVALAYGLTSVVVEQSGGLRTEGRTVRLDTQDLEVCFTRLTALSDSFMLFGGNATQVRNSFTHAIVAALAIDEARLISARYPDFHLCKSPGAANAKRLIQTLSFVGASSGTRRTLAKAVDLHLERVRSGGIRTCLTIAGAELALDSIRLKENAADITEQVRSKLDSTRLILVESAEIVDCEPLLR